MGMKLWLSVGVAAVAALGTSGVAGSGTISRAQPAADINPKTLVLRKADVPAGFRLRLGEAVSNEKLGGNESEYIDAIARSGRVTGYRVAFELDKTGIASLADSFRSSRGAQMFLREEGRRTTKDKCQGYYGNVSQVGKRVGPFGAAGSIYQVEYCEGKGESPPGGVHYVMWRQGRIVSGVIGFGISRSQTIALARVQQRRVAGAAG